MYSSSMHGIEIAVVQLTNQPFTHTVTLTHTLRAAEIVIVVILKYSVVLVGRGTVVVIE